MISGRRNTSFYNEELSLGLHGYVTLGLNDHIIMFTYSFVGVVSRHGRFGMKGMWRISLIWKYIVQI